MRSVVVMSSKNTRDITSTPQELAEWRVPFWLKLLWATELVPALHTLITMSLLAKPVDYSAVQVALWATAEAGSQLAECSWEMVSLKTGSGALLAVAALIVFSLGFCTGVAVQSSGFKGRCVSRDAMAEAPTPTRSASTQLDWDWDGYEACEPCAAAPSPLERPPAEGREQRSMLVQSPVNYTWWRSCPRFAPLRERSHGAWAD